MRLPDSYLSRREQQILEILYRESPLLAAEVRERLPDSPGNSTVRKLLSNLEEKGSIQHTEVEGRFLYAPTFPKVEAGRSILQNVVQTFFAGSLSQTVAALLTGGSHLSLAERERIQQMIEQAEQNERNGPSERQEQTEPQESAEHTEHIEQVEKTEQEEKAR